MTDCAEKLLKTRYVVAMEPHITLDEEKCAACAQKACLYFCPAGCFTEENEVLKFQYAGCLECGTCRATCSNDAITWNYPLGGYGVSYRYG